MIHIVSCIDKNYVMPTGIMMKTLCINNPDDEFTFHVVVDESVRENQKNKLAHVLSEHLRVQIFFYPFEKNILKSYPRIGEVFPHISKAAYYRLFVGEILPDNLSKVIYLDGDVIVKNGLSRLWNVNMDSHPVGAVQDGFDEAERYERLGYQQSLGYFNSGVLLINLEYWRKHNMTTVFLNFINNHSDIIKFHDQDVLNYIFRENKLMLPLKFNVQNSFFYHKDFIGIDTEKYKEQLDEAISHPVIIHFTMPQKPWIIGCQHPYAKEFEKYRNMTPWRHRCIIDTLRYSGLRHTVGYYARKLGLIPPMEDPYISL